MRLEFVMVVERSDGSVVDVSVCADATPVVRGRYFGPPESCYPDEGGELEIESVVIVGADREDGTPDESVIGLSVLEDSHVRRQVEAEVESRLVDAIERREEEAAVADWEDRE